MLSWNVWEIWRYLWFEKRVCDFFFQLSAQFHQYRSWLSTHSNSRLGNSIGFSSWNPPIMTANFSQSSRCRSHIREELFIRQQQPMVSQPRRRFLVVHWNISFETSWNHPPWIHSSFWPPPCTYLRLTTTLPHKGSHYLSVTWTALCLPSPVVSLRSIFLLEEVHSAAGENASISHTSR